MQKKNSETTRIDSQKDRTDTLTKCLGTHTAYLDNQTDYPDIHRVKQSGKNYRHPHKTSGEPNKLSGHLN